MKGLQKIGTSTPSRDWASSRLGIHKNFHSIRKCLSVKSTSLDTKRRVRVPNPQDRARLGVEPIDKKRQWRYNRAVWKYVPFIGLFFYLKDLENPLEKRQFYHFLLLHFYLLVLPLGLLYLSFVLPFFLESIGKLFFALVCAFGMGLFLHFYYKVLLSKK